ncbi:ABC transporter permease [Candidatus Thorarchaeota archaeon]|nr:MAG: ABC transporter permease [Candidatus Thorarchaeota archaeon]
MFLISRLTSQSPQVLATLLMFSLSAGVLGGVLFYMDSTSSNVLEEMTQEIPIDMEVKCTSEFYETNATTIDLIAAIIDEQKLVVDTEIVAFMDSSDNEFPEVRFRKYTYLGVDNSIFDTFPKAIQVVTKLDDLNDTSCYLEQEWADYLELEIGSIYVAEIVAINTNYTVERYNASFTIVGIFTTNTFRSHIDSSGNSITSLRMITTRNGLMSEFGNVGHQSIQDTFYSIWTRFDSRFIIHGSPSIVESSLSDVKKKIEQRTLPYAKVSDFEILGIVFGYNTWASTMTIISLAFSIPSIVMGIMLLVYNSRLMEDQHRRETGTLITRGSSGWQSFNWVISSALVTGVIGSVGAVLTGALAALLSGGVRQLLVFSGEELFSFNLLLEPTSITIIFVFSFIVGFAISLPSAINALLLIPDEAHSVVERQSLAGKEKIRSPIAEVIAVIVSGLLVTPLLSTLSSGAVSSNGLVLFAALVIMMFGIFIVSIARILSIPASFIKSKMLGLFQSASSTPGIRLISRNAILAKKSEAMGVMFIGLVFTAGFFSIVSSTTGSNHMTELFHFDVGADIVINVNEDLRYTSNEIVERIRSIEGVNNASALLKTYARVLYLQAIEPQGLVLVNTSLPIYAVDSLSWIQTAFILPYFTKSGHPYDTIPLLSSNETNVISSFMPIKQYVEGQAVYNNSVSVSIQTTNQNYILDCSIVDVMSTDYASRSVSYFPGEPEVRDFLIMNIMYIQTLLNTSRVDKIFIDVADGANYTRVMEDIRNIANFTSEEIVSSQTGIDEVLDSRTGQSIYGVYTLNLLFSLIYLTAGLMIISLVKTRRLQRQFSILRALGTPNSSIMHASIVDIGVSMIQGILIGSIVGLILSRFVLQIPLAYLGLTTEIVWSRLPVFLSIPLPLLLGFIILSFSSAFITTYLATKKSLSSNLACDIRNTE